MEQIYLLRVWTDREGWQASLRNLETKEVKFFADHELFQRFFATGLEPELESNYNLQMLEAAHSPLDSSRVPSSLEKEEEVRDASMKQAILGEELKGSSE